MWLKKSFWMFLIVFTFVVYLKPGLMFPDGSSSMELKEPHRKTSATPIAIYSDRIEIYGKPYFIPRDNILYVEEK